MNSGAGFLNNKDIPVRDVILVFVWSEFLHMP